jgi:hypothetical protein
LSRINAKYDVKKFMLDSIDQYSELYKKERQGPRKWEESAKIAEDISGRIGTRPSALLTEIKRRTNDLEAYMLLARDMLNKSATELSEASKTAVYRSKDGEMQQADLDRVAELSTLHAEIEAGILGGSSKIGRALAVHRRNSTATNKYGYVLSTFRDKSFSSDLVQALAMVDPMDTATISKMIRDSVSPKFKDYIRAYWYNNILSGIPTHMVNIGSNLGWSQYLLGPEKILKAVVDVPVSKLQGREREYYFKEIIPSYIGLKRGISQGFAKGLYLLRSGNLEGVETKITMERGAKMNPFTYSPHKALRAVAPLIEAPTRLLGGEDVMFKGMAFEAEMYAQAARKALKEGKKGKEFRIRMEELAKNPTPEMVESADKFADYATFTDMPGEWTKSFLQLRNKTPGGWLVVPFVNTVGNLLKRGTEMIPVAGLAIQKGAKGPEVTDVIVKQIMGAMLMAFVAAKFADEEVLGAAPRNPAEKERFYASGKQPWSFKFGDKYVQYRRMEPFNTTIGVAVTVLDKMKKDGEAPTDELLTSTALGIGRNLFDAGYLGTVSDLIEAMERGEQNPQSFLRIIPRMAGGLVPYSSFLRSMTRATESHRTGKAPLRKPRGIKEGIKAGIPILAEDIRTKKDIWGEDIEIEGGPIRHFLPWKYGTETKDPLEVELNKIGVAIGIPKPTIKGIDLTQDQYDKILKTIGKRAKAKILSRIKGAGYQRLSDEKKAEKIEEWYKGVAKSVKNQIYNQELRGQK